MAGKMLTIGLEDVKEKIRSAFPFGRKKCSLDEFNHRFRCIIGHKLPFKEFQYQTDVEFLKSIPDTVSIRRMKSGEYFVQEVELKRTDSSGSDLSAQCRLYGLTSADCESNDFKDSVKPPFASIHKSIPSFMSEVPEEPESSSVVPEHVRRNLLKLLEMYPCGMCASDFPSLYEEVNHITFDHRGLGFDCLADFIDAVSDIFKRKHIAGIKRDWLILPADMEDETFAENADLPKNNSVVVDNVIQNIRKMLVKYYPGGIPLDSFLHIYTRNYQDIINIRDLGFDKIECFLSNISKYVPLRMDKDNICKSSYVYFVTDAAPEIFGEEALPHDIVPSDSEFSLQELPSNIDYSKYFAAYLSHVYSPEEFYIQIVGRDTTDAVEIVQDKLHKFCRGPWSYNYKMRSAHIKVGAICAAMFTDNFWYRGKIVSIPSLEMVEVYYVDYGSKSIISVNDLRYLRQEDVELPAQALKSRLAYIKPKGEAWPAGMNKKIVSYTNNAVMMAKIEECVADGVLSLTVCDTRGENDIYINQVLVDEGYAVPDVNSSEIVFQASDGSDTPSFQVGSAQNVPSLIPHVAGASPIAGNDVILSLLQNLVISYAHNPQLLQQHLQNSVTGPLFNAPSNRSTGNPSIQTNPLSNTTGLASHLPIPNSSSPNGSNLPGYDNFPLNSQLVKPGAAPFYAKKVKQMKKPSSDDTEPKTVNKSDGCTEMLKSAENFDKLQQCLQEALLHIKGIAYKF